MFADVGLAFVCQTHHVRRFSNNSFIKLKKHIPGRFVNQEIVPDMILHSHFINLPVLQIKTYGTLPFNLWDFDFCRKPTNNGILIF